MSGTMPDPRPDDWGQTGATRPLRFWLHNAELTCAAESNLAKPSNRFSDGPSMNRRRTSGVKFNEMLSTPAFCLRSGTTAPEPWTARAGEAPTILLP